MSHRPFFFALIYSFAFGTVMRVSMPNYTQFILAGLFAWQWFSNGLTSSTNIFISNNTIIKKVAFPKQLLVLASVCQDMMHFVLTLPILAGFLAWKQIWPSWTWLIAVPLLVFTQGLFLYSAALLLATINLFVRDIERLVGLFCSALFFITPVVSSAEMFPERYQWILELNPAAWIMISWRHLFLSGIIEWMMIGKLFLVGACLYGVSEWVYQKLQLRFAEVL